MSSGESRRDRQAAAIANKLEAFGLDVAEGDCSCGIVCVVVFHHGQPDSDARAPVEVDPDEDGPRWEEKLQWEGRQIPHAVSQAADLDPTEDDRETALAVMRTSQDVDTWT